MENRKFDDLIHLLKKLGSVVVAFSGGVDSSFLLYAAHKALGDRAIAVLGTSPIHPKWEHQQAIDLARQLGVRLIGVETTEMQNEAFTSNPPNRCYICKKAIMGTLRELAEKEGFAHVIEGSNVDDLGDFRPGMDALKELGIHSPLLEVGLTKKEIRTLSKEIGLPTWDRPSMACLASRIPYGREITTQKLARVAVTELTLRDLGFDQLRVRDHGEIARIELKPDDIARAADERTRTAIIKAGESAGYTYVCLDLKGYRTGAMNEVLGSEI